MDAAAVFDNYLRFPRQHIFMTGCENLELALEMNDTISLYSICHDSNKTISNLEMQRYLII